MLPDTLFTALCLIAFGRPGLQLVWQNVQDDNGFKECKDRIIQRITTVSVVVCQRFTIRNLLFEPQRSHHVSSCIGRLDSEFHRGVCDDHSTSWSHS